MNKRIKELQIEAENLTDVAHLDAISNGYNSDWQDVFCEKFAELIALDCADVVIEVVKGKESVDAINALYNRFGIE